MTNDEESIQTGASDIKTVKAGCGIRFDPDTLSEEAGFDFSEASKLADCDSEKESESTLESPTRSN